MSSNSTRLGRPLVAAALLSVALAGCDQGSVDEIRSEIGDVISEVESEVDQATDEPATEEPATEEPATEDTTDVSDWLPLVLGLLVLALVLALIMGALRRGRERRRASAAEIRAALGELVGTGRWVLDQGSVEVQRITEPQQLQRSWTMVRERLVGMEERITTMVVDLRDDALVEALTGLAAASESLRSVLDGTVSLRTGTTTDPELESDNRLAVQQRRREFGAALDRVSSFR